MGRSLSLGCESKVVGVCRVFNTKTGFLVEGEVFLAAHQDFSRAAEIPDG